MKSRREFLKDTATGVLILGSQNELGVAGMLDRCAKTENPEEDRSLTLPLCSGSMAHVTARRTPR